MAGMTVQRATKRRWAQQLLGKLLAAVISLFRPLLSADISLFSARCGSPKSEQLQCLERRRETEFGAGTANVAKAGHL
jgi:hypothetical protein